MNQNAITHYLSRYAEPETQALDELVGSWSHVVCIPACNEEASFLDTLQSLRDAQGGEQVLVIVVVNGADDAASHVHANNQTFLDVVREACGLLPHLNGLGNFNGLSVLLIDRASEGKRLPPKQGVGLARKIATDLGLALFDQGKVTSPWLLCTDADVAVPHDYFTALPGLEISLSAAVFPFEHVLEGPKEQQEAMLLYECYLHYYVLGLRSVRSPYAFHTIGSLFALRADAYAVVRGFPKRQAGEDFYILNKLVKVAPVMPLKSAPMRIRGRTSDRVPFGTGAALSQIDQTHAQGEAYVVYDARVFQALGCWILALYNFAQTKDAVALKAAVLADSCLPENGLLGALEEQGAVKAAIDASGQTRVGAPLFRRLFEWNDAFRTLKLVHALRDQWMPSLPLLDAVQQAEFLEGTCPNTLEGALAWLREQVEQTYGHPIGLQQNLVNSP